MDFTSDPIVTYYCDTKEGLISTQISKKGAKLPFWAPSLYEDSG